MLSGSFLLYKKPHILTLSVTRALVQVKKLHWLNIHIPEYDGKWALLHAQTGSHEKLDVLMPDAAQGCYLVEEANQVLHLSHSPWPHLHISVPVPTAHVHKKGKSDTVESVKIILAN